MTTMVSVILALMLTIGGGPANTVNPVNPVKYISPGDNSSDLNINQKPHLDEKFTTPQIYRGFNFQKGQYKRALGFSFSKLPQTGRFLQVDPMGYQDSLNLYQAFNLNPVNFTDPFGKQHQVTVTPEGAEFERPMTVGEFWETLMEAGVSQKEALNLIAESTYYSKFFWDGSLVDRIKTHRMDLTLTNSEARALGMEYNITLKGPREQFGRLIRGEFKEFKDAALENLDRAFGDPENAALMFSGGVKYKGGKPYPFFNKKGILQWRDPSTGQFTKSPIRLPEGVEWPKGFGDPTKWKSMLKDLTAEVDEMKASREFYERLSKSKSAGDLWDAIEASIKKSKKTYGDILFEQIEKALKKEKK